MVDDPPGATTTVHVAHHTTYRFERPVRLSPHVIRFRPADRSPSPTWDHEVVVAPAGASLAWQRTASREWAGRLEVRGRVAGLTIDAGFWARIAPADPLRDVTGGPDAPGFQLASATARRVQGALAHVADHGEEVASPDVVLARGTASCRDSSHVLVHELQAAGLTARFVAGYLVRLAGWDDLVAGPWPAVVPAGEDVVAYHAWAEVLLPGRGRPGAEGGAHDRSGDPAGSPTTAGSTTTAGSPTAGGEGLRGGVWVGLDATTGRPSGGGHLPVASGPHPRDTVPVAGRTEPTSVQLTTSHSLRRR